MGKIEQLVKLSKRKKYTNEGILEKVFTGMATHFFYYLFFCELSDREYMLLVPPAMSAARRDWEQLLLLVRQWSRVIGREKVMLMLG